VCDNAVYERIVCERQCVKGSVWKLLCSSLFRVCESVVCVCLCGSLCVQVRERDVSDKVACERTVCSSLCERVV